MNRSGHVVWFKVFVLGGLFTVVKNVGFFSRGFVFRTSTGMSSSLEPLSRDKDCSVVSGKCFMSFMESS